MAAPKKKSALKKKPSTKAKAKPGTGENTSSKGKVGKPTKYSAEIVDRICSLIATTTKSMNTICKEVGIDYTTHQKWLREKEDYSLNYVRAKEDQADLLAEQILEIADDSVQDTKTINKFGQEIEVENTEWVNRSKIRIDARKWIASKLKPKKYGDSMKLSGDKENPVIIEQITGMKIE